jgi:hypothetical protein
MKLSLIVGYGRLLSLKHPYNGLYPTHSWRKRAKASADSVLQFLRQILAIQKQCDLETMNNHKALTFLEIKMMQDSHINDTCIHPLSSAVPTYKRLGLRVGCGYAGGTGLSSALLSTPSCVLFNWPVVLWPLQLPVSDLSLFSEVSATDSRPQHGPKQLLLKSARRIQRSASNPIPILPRESPSGLLFQRT